jgi:hypothetical protein
VRTRGHAFPLSDTALARRLERAEGEAAAAVVDARREVQPETRAAWVDIAGVYAMFDGVDSPLTQTFGLGLFEPFHTREFERVEAFFAGRGAAIAHEVCSFAPPGTAGLLGARGYSPIESSTVLVRPTGADIETDANGIVVRIIDASEDELWTRVSAEAWCHEAPDLRPFIERLGAVLARTRNVIRFLAEQDGMPLATAALNLCNDVALLAGAATVPSARRRGAQRALLRARLDVAAARGVGLAMIVAQPGSASQRNAERQGFRPVYTRAKWQKPSGGDSGRMLEGNLSVAVSQGQGAGR